MYALLLDITRRPDFQDAASQRMGGVSNGDDDHSDGVESVTPRNNKDEGKEPETTVEGQPCQTLDPPTDQDARKNSHPDLRMSTKQCST